MKPAKASSGEIGPALSYLARHGIQQALDDRDLLAGMGLLSTDSLHLRKELSAIILFAVIAAVMQSYNLRKWGKTLLDDMHFQFFEAVRRSGELPEPELEGFESFLHSRYRQYSGALGREITGAGLEKFAFVAHGDLRGKETDDFAEALPVFAQIFMPTFEGVLETLRDTRLADEPVRRWTIERQPSGATRMTLGAKRKSLLQRLRSLLRWN